MNVHSENQCSEFLAKTFYASLGFVDSHHRRFVNLLEDHEFVL